MKLTFLYLLTGLLISGSSFAQTQRGIIGGKVTDGNNLPLSGAGISLEKTSYATACDERGNFQMKVPTGTYHLVVSALGYKVHRSTITVIMEKDTTVTIRLLADGIQMDEVLVSGIKVQSSVATRMLTQLQDIPQSISVMGQRVVRQQAAFDLTTLTRNMPGINFTGNYSGAGSSQFFNARGFDLNETQNFRWNGMMVLNWGNQYADNIEQVEFLKGPGSILFGDAAPGGVLNFVTKKPQSEFSANLNFKTGSWGLLRPSLDITGPILKDRSLRYRLNTSLEKRNSFRDHVSSDLAFAAPSLAWDISSKLTVNLEAVFRSSTATDDAGLVSADGTLAGLRSLSPSLYLGEPSRKYLYDDISYFASLNYELNSTWRIKATAFQGRTTNRPFGIWFDQPDSDGNFTRRGYGFYRHAFNQSFSADASGIFYTGAIKHRLLFGLEYQSSRSRQTNGGDLDSLDTNNIETPVYGQSLTPEPSRAPFLPYAAVIERLGIHFQDQLSLMEDRMQLLVGLRAGSTGQGNRYLQNEVSGTVYEGLRDDVVKKFVFIPRIGLVYKPAANYSLYASFSRGYEINSPDLFARNYAEFANPPATLSKQVEFGLKTSLLSNRLGCTIALFEIGKKNPYGYVYLDPENPNYDAYNVYYDGHHRSRGIEIELDGNIYPFLSVNAGLAYTEAKVINDPGYPAGNLLPNAPRFTANCWINYEGTDFLNGLSLGTGIFYKDRFYSGINNDPKLMIPAACTWDAAAGYHYKQGGVQFNVINITNAVSYLNPWQFNLFDVKPPRQLVVTLSYRFGK